MTGNIKAVADTLNGAETITLDGGEDAKKNASGSSHIGGNGPDFDFPDNPPVLPLGQANGKFYFLTARGEMAELTAGAMTQRANIVALVAGADNGIKWLGELATPSNRDVGFNPAGVADALMMACSKLPLFDTNMAIRNWGTWRGSDKNIVVHLGEDLECPEGQTRRGRLIDRALYPAVAATGAPATDMASAKDVQWLCDRIARYWNWKGDAQAAPIIMGWIGQAALGQYPKWRTHMWIKGSHGSGKTTLVEIIASALGGMCTEVKNATSAAAIRQTTNRQAIARIFDEAEADGAGQVESVVALFRLMSDADGAKFERGTSDHSGVRFALYGAGLLSSIIPVTLTPQDKSRFVMLSMGAREVSDSPEEAGLRVTDLAEDARRLGGGIWRRMLTLAPDRWDVTFNFYSATLQGMGAKSRDADTIGAILAGWDLMLYDGPVVADGKHLDANRIELAKVIAGPLLRSAKTAEQEGEGDRCLRAMLQTQLQKDHGGVASAGELIEMLQEQDPQDVERSYNKILGRIGLRLMDGPKGHKNLFVSNGRSQILEASLKGTSWRGGGHRPALELLDGAEPSEKAIRVLGGSPSRGLIIPARYLPGCPEND